MLFLNYDYFINWSLKVINMSNMFYGCESLDKINLSQFYTSSVEAMHNMFYGCNSLKVLDISRFNMSKCTSYNNMFSNVPENVAVCIVNNTNSTTILFIGYLLIGKFCFYTKNKNNH